MPMRIALNVPLYQYDNNNKSIWTIALEFKTKSMLASVCLG